VSIDDVWERAIPGVESLGCADALDRIVALLDGELPAAEARGVRRHLSTCAACAATMEESARVLRLTDAWRVDAPGDVTGLADVVLAAREEAASAAAVPEQRVEDATALLLELRAMRQGMATLHGQMVETRREVADLHRQLAAARVRSAGAARSRTPAGSQRLMPFATPADTRSPFGN
jgi:anti-sigma factor RsiW